MVLPPCRRLLNAELILAFGFAAFMAVPASAQGQTAESAVIPPPALPFSANVKPSLPIRRSAGPITIDGELGDAGWVGAAKATNWAERFPKDNVKPPVETEAWIAYDDTHLYVAFIAYDDPSKLRANLRDRDQIYQDDFIGFMLDTYGDGAWAYELYVNPRGVQGDLKMTGDGNEDDGFDVIWQSSAKVLDDRWQVEIAFPFESMRFPKRPIQAWKVNFWRTQPREVRRQITWSRIDRSDPCFMCQWGTIEGIQGASPGGALEILPAVVGSQTGSLADPDDPNSSFDNGSFKGELGVGLKYSFAGGLTAEATANPDFSQIESDAPQIDVNTTFALFYPERRPFFQEGSELFETYIDAVYTRQINNPYGAAKLVGRKGRTAVAYLGGVDETTPILIPFEERSFVGTTGSSVSNIGRFRQTFGRQSNAGAIVTDRRYDGGGYNSVAGFDGAWQVRGPWRLEGQLLGSWTREPDDTAATSGLDVTFDDGKHTGAWDGESFNGHATYLSLERDARTWDINLDYYDASPAFRADNGFEFSNSYRLFSAFTGLAFYPANDFISQFNPTLYGEVQYNWDGELKRTFVEPSLEFNLTAQTYLDLEVSWVEETFKGVTFDNMFRPQLYFQTRPNRWLDIWTFLAHGDGIYRAPALPLPATGTDIEFGGTLKPMGQLTIEPSFVYSKQTGESGETFFSGWIGRARIGVQFTRAFFLRLITQYDDFDDRWSVQPLLTYRVNPFTLFYAGASQDWMGVPGEGSYSKSQQQFFVKFQYLIRR